LNEAFDWGAEAKEKTRTGWKSFFEGKANFRAFTGKLS